MPLNAYNTGITASSDDTTHLTNLESATSGWPAAFYTIVNAVMRYHNRAAAEAGIRAFNGGHVRIPDNKALYNKVLDYIAEGSTAAYVLSWVPLVNTPFTLTRGGSRKGTQSHPTVDTAYEVTMPAGWGCLLFGTYETGANQGNATGTWFQAEGTSVKRDTVSMVYHTVKDFAAYKLSGLQQGPIGTSDRSDQNPLIVAATDVVALSTL